MKLYALPIFISLFTINAFASIPVRHTELLDFVQESPNQGDTGTCMFMASTGAVELLLNQKYNIRNPQKDDIFDISEVSTIGQKKYKAKYSLLKGMARFKTGWTVLNKDLPYNAFKEDGSVNRGVWRKPSGFYDLPRLEIAEKFNTKKLFIRGKDKYSRNVLNEKHISQVKRELSSNNAPILINYNHNRWWHMVLIVGYDDEAVGECLHTKAEKCRAKGAFYVRDSLGKKTHLRSYDWFKVNGNAAFTVTIK